MVLILLSSPTSAASTLSWPPTPKSSSSFFAILSPIFTTDDAVPASPAGLLQVSPGAIPPITPPPWLVGAASPTPSPRPAPSRSNSYYERPTPQRASTNDTLRPRPTLPNAAYSFTAGRSETFRPRPLLAPKRTMTQPLTSAPKSPLRRALGNASKPVLAIRPPTREERSLASEFETEMLPIALDIASPVDSECMEIPIALEKTVPDWTLSTTEDPRSLPRPASLRFSSLYNPLQLTAVQTPRLDITEANLKQHNLACR